MIKKINGHMAAADQGEVHEGLEARQNKDKSVEAGREFVEAYVTYMHYVEGIHTSIVTGGGHHHEGAVERSVPTDPKLKEHQH